MDHQFDDILAAAKDPYPSPYAARGNRSPRTVHTASHAATPPAPRLFDNVTTPRRWESIPLATLSVNADYDDDMYKDGECDGDEAFDRGVCKIKGSSSRGGGGGGGRSYHSVRSLWLWWIWSFLSSQVRVRFDLMFRCAT